MTATIKSLGAAAVARYEAKHREADDLQFNSVGFHVEANRKTFCAVVRDHIIASGATWKQVCDLSKMHNARLGDSMRG